MVAGLLGLGALYFTYLCNGLSYENKPAKVGSHFSSSVRFTLGYSYLEEIHTLKV